MWILHGSKWYWIALQKVYTNFHSQLIVWLCPLPHISLQCEYLNLNYTVLNESADTILRDWKLPCHFFCTPLDWDVYNKAYSHKKSLFFFSMWGLRKKVDICKPKRQFLPRTELASSLIVDLASRIVRNKYLLFKPPSLWYFVKVLFLLSFN